MRRKSSGVAVVALLAGIAVGVTLYIASFGRSSHHAEATPDPHEQTEALAQASASDAAFAIAPMPAASDPQAQTAAR
jgi:hypothetical protein